MANLLLDMHIAWRTKADETVRTTQIKPSTMMAWEREHPDSNAMVALLNCRLVDTLWMLKHQEMPFDPTLTLESLVDTLDDLHLHVGGLPRDPLATPELQSTVSETSESASPDESPASQSASLYPLQL